MDFPVFYPLLLSSLWSSKFQAFSIYVKIPFFFLLIWIGVPHVRKGRADI